MLIENLDRTWWTLQRAREHVATQIFAREPLEASEETATSSPWVGRRNVLPKPKPLTEQERRERAYRQALQELLIALRDGDLHATGRVSTNHNGSYQSGDNGWLLHSGHHSYILPNDWHGGLDRSDSRLTTNESQYIDIRVLRFAVLAIWPEVENPPPATDYRTPYMDLLERAITEFGLTEANQSKKECLLDWFKQQEVEGETISNNLADAMATLVRLPASQRGGAKRASGC